MASRRTAISRTRTRSTSPSGPSMRAKALAWFLVALMIGATFAALAYVLI